MLPHLQPSYATSLCTFFTAALHFFSPQPQALLPSLSLFSASLHSFIFQPYMRRSCFPRTCITCGSLQCVACSFGFVECNRFFPCHFAAPQILVYGRLPINTCTRARKSLMLKAVFGGLLSGSRRFLILCW